MDRKRGDVAISSPKAQITIFMILGLVILFVFLFLIQLSTRLNQDKLELSKENVVAQAFKKEGLRLYVDDCLRDELEQGLLLLGRQGRLWADQPGGRLNFEPGKTGIIYAPGEELGEFDSSRVAYGLTRKTYLEHENAYPCTEEADAPAFCQYRFPNTSLSFGSLELLPSTLKGDLQRFMANRTVWCVQQFLLNNVSRQVVLESKPADVSVDVFDDGISVKSEYPLRFKVGQNEFFHLSTFDFFYSSQFGKFLNDIITFPLQQDQHYLDFNYSPENLNKESFTFSSEVFLGQNCQEDPQNNIFVCQRSLRPETMGSLAVEITAAAAENGDDVFTFRPALYKIVNSPAPFVFRVARQNRPPALSYINRSQCPAGGYDYLVIEGHETLGGINISAFAIDPDEDAINYEFDNKVGARRIEVGNNYNFSIMKEDMDAITPSPEPYVVVVNVTDSHKQSDWQQVRILVDRPMQPTISLRSPYEDPQASYDLGENRYRLSKEDPVYLTFSIPEASRNYLSSGEEVVFNYDYNPEDDVEPENIRLDYSQGRPPTGEVCYNLPIFQLQMIRPEQPADTCDTLAGYTEQDVVQGFPEQFHFFRQPTANGKLKLGYSVNYCGTNTQEESTSLNVQVKDCVPHKNPAHPWGYDPDEHYEQYKYGVNLEGKTADYLGDAKRKDINPFETTHACCINWELVGKNDLSTPCFEDPKARCSVEGTGQIPTLDRDSLILKQQKRLCGGESGILCNGDKTWVLFDNELRCGSNGVGGCGGVVKQCQDNLSYSIITKEGAEKGWCYGETGCSSFCDQNDGLVYTIRGDPPAHININDLAKGLIISGTIPQERSTQFPYRCGCTSETEGNWCDKDYNGIFESTCQQGSCKLPE